MKKSEKDNSLKILASKYVAQNYSSASVDVILCALKAYKAGYAQRVGEETETPYYRRRALIKRSVLEEILARRKKK